MTQGVNPPEDQRRNSNLLNILLHHRNKHKQSNKCGISVKFILTLLSTLRCSSSLRIASITVVVFVYFIF